MFPKLELPEIESVEIYAPGKPEALRLEVSEPSAWQATKFVAKNPPYRISMPIHR